jgi:hypothetical protein
MSYEFDIVFKVINRGIHQSNSLEVLKRGGIKTVGHFFIKMGAIWEKDFW